jgi:cytochrome c6
MKPDAKIPFATAAFIFFLLLCPVHSRAEAEGAELFNQQCTSCHGRDGRAQTPIARKLAVKDLTQSRIADAAIRKQITEGSKTADGKEKMPPFQQKLSAAQIESLVQVVKSFRK